MKDSEEQQKSTSNEAMALNKWTNIFDLAFLNRFDTAKKRFISKFDENQNDVVWMSSIEKDEIEEQIIKLEHEKKKILHEINEGVNNFDMLLYELRKQRFHIGTEVKLGEIKFFTLLEEFEFLTTFDDKEEVLRKKLDKCQNDKYEVSKDVKNRCVIFTL